MKKNEITRKLSKELKLSPEESKKVVDFVLQGVLHSGLSGEGFSSSILKVIVKDKAEKVNYTPEGEKHVPARKTMLVMPSKKYVEGIAS